MLKKYIILIICSLLLIGCHNNTNNDNSTDTNQDNTKMFTDRDKDTSYNENECILIELHQDKITCSDDSINIKDTTITLSKEASYFIKGTLDDGMIIIDADSKDKLHLILDNVNINSTTSAPVYIKQADKVFITLSDESKNTLSNSGTFDAVDENNIDAVIFSKDDLTINGSGSLEINSPSGHGIVSKDDLVFTGGTYTIKSSSHGLTANDSIRLTDSCMTIVSGKDGMKANNDEDTSKGFVYIENGTYNMTCEGDGISASYNMTIQDGTFDILCGGGSKNASTQTSENWGGFPGQRPGGHRDPSHHGMSQQNSTITDANEDSTSIKGLKSSGDLIINNGTFTIDSADDTIHSNGSITIHNGNYELASGDDGIHADETLTIHDGTINITKSYEGLEALHIKINEGDIKLIASDDGLNAAGGNDSSGSGGFRGGDQFGASSNGSIIINGGNIYANASGDGIDANGYIEITGGYTVIVGPTNGDTATLDYDTTADINGGTFIGTGAVMMAQTFSESSSQGVFAVQANASANTKITLTDSSGKEIISYSPELSYNVIILSHPDIKKGESYSVKVGNASGTFEAY